MWNVSTMILILGPFPSLPSLPFPPFGTNSVGTNSVISPSYVCDTAKWPTKNHTKQISKIQYLCPITTRYKSYIIPGETLIPGARGSVSPWYWIYLQPNHHPPSFFVCVTMHTLVPQLGISPTPLLLLGNSTPKRENGKVSNDENKRQWIIVLTGT